MKKILAILFMLVFTLGANAKSLKKEVTDVITESGIEKSSISISVKNLSNEKPVFLLNDKTLMHPASVQKVLTLPSYIDVLSEDYEFSTGLYLRGNDEYIIKLGADPFLDSSDLKSLVREIDKQKVKKISIDDSIIESKDWGEGWQWDDDLNISMPRFNSYNLDNNFVKITVMPQDGKITIINPSNYPLAFINNVEIGEHKGVTVSRDSANYSNTLTLTGSISKPCTIYIPTNNLKRYFDIKLTQALANKNIYLKEKFSNTKIKESDKLIAEVKHPILNAEDEILKNSNNLMIETVGKLAASKAYNTVGTDSGGNKIFREYCNNLSLDDSKIRLVDGSGVSKNNLISSDFVTEYLIKSKDNKTLKKMAKPGEGTLSERLMTLKDNLRAKTGTLSDISSIAGYLDTKSGNKYVFCIIINDPKSSKSDKVILEDYIIRALYLKG